MLGRITRLSVVLLLVFAVAAQAGPRARADGQIDVLPVSGQAVPALSAFDTAIQNFMAAHGLEAGTLAVMKDGQILLSRGYGWQDAAHTTQLQPDALMRIASNSKPITAAAIKKLIANGLLSAGAQVFCTPAAPTNCLLHIDPPPGDTVDPRLDDITVQMLLDHTAGWDQTISGDPITSSVAIAADLGVPSPPTKHQFASWLVGNQPLDHDPGATYAYSNIGYLFLGLIIEAVTGGSYMDYVQRAILSPLGIIDIGSGRSLPADRDPREPWYVDPGTGPNVFDPAQTAPWTDGGMHWEMFEAFGGLVASAPALLNFSEGYFPNGEPNPRQPGWDWTFYGSLPGTLSMVRWRSDRVSIAALFNERVDPNGAEYNPDSLRQALDNVAAGITSWPTPSDTAAPRSAAFLTPAANTAGWNTTNVTVNLTASDNSGPSGVRKITYSASGAQPIASKTVRATTKSFTLSTEGVTVISFAAADTSGNIESTQTVTVRIDRTRPTVVRPPSLKFQIDSTLGLSTIRVNAYNWLGADPGPGASGLARYQLGQRRNGGDFQTVNLRGPLVTHAPRALTPGNSYLFRLEAVDTAGKVSLPTSTATYALALHQETDGVSSTGGWTSESVASASGGTRQYATIAGVGMTFNFTGTHVAWVSIRGPLCGRAEVWLDGQLVQMLDLYTGVEQPRRVVYVANNLPDGPHTLEIRALGTRTAASGGTRVYVDAVAVLNPV